jgi:hypothetical protein
MRSRVLKCVTATLLGAAWAWLAGHAIAADSGTMQHRIQARSGPLPQARSRLVEFETAPFPYAGIVPRANKPFLDVDEQGRRGHRANGGHIFWEDETYSDRRVLLHIPRGFDVRRPAFLVVFFHGHGATLADDVYARQQVPAQISVSGINAVLVAPQLASNAADSSAGKLWEPGAFAHFLDEAAEHLAHLHGDPRSVRVFGNIPVVIVAYSGGYLPAAWSIHHGGLAHRLRGVVLFDALYGELDIFTEWITKARSGFFVSTYSHLTRARNTELQRILGEREVAFGMSLEPRLRPGSVAFLPAPPEADHKDFLTQAWVEDPLKDLLTRLGGSWRP